MIMKKSKLQNTTTIDITGKRIIPNLYTSHAGDYLPGDILDANSTMDKVSEKISELVGDAPTTLDTLEELAEKTLQLEYNAEVSNVSYSQLKTLKNNGNLVIGKQYRITDYNCTCGLSGYSMGNHQFDIIVTADSERTFNENATAAIHYGDTYFANSNLAAWELKYDINNDSNKYAWADSTNGKGVIYYMKDEFNNECPYDFKNIRYLSHGSYYYTFDLNATSDHSLNGAYCFGNSIKDYITNNKKSLNITFFKNTSATSLCSGNTFGVGCGINVFGDSCHNNTFGKNCYQNTFGNLAQYNTFGNMCYLNTFGDKCKNNTFSNNCNNNTAQGSFMSNTIGNTVKNCQFANNFVSNTIGNECQNIVFSNDYSIFNIVENGNQSITVTSLTSTTSSNQLKYCRICQGFNATNTVKTINVVPGCNYHQTFGDSLSGTTFPTASDVGDVFFDTSDSTPYWWNGIEWVRASNINELLIPITYSELKTLRDNNELVAGQHYRITDYVCTTTQEDTQSANHPFDIIVTADSASTLNEDAKAIQHSDDTYFSNCNLAAWELKYSLDNNTNRFAWADSTNGKGVIFYMKDEWNNEVPYDFKNIQFKRKLVFDNGYPEYDETNGTETWIYTFAANSYHITNDEWSTMKDGSLESPYGHESDESSGTYINNTIKEYILLYDREDEDYTKCGKQYLNNIVFLGYWEEVGSDEPENYPYYYAYCSYNCSFGLNCHANTFECRCHSNTFGHNCYSNTFEHNCYSNTFGSNCNSNTFGHNCNSNTFGDDCYSNTFGDMCYSNTFGDSCYSNTFGDDCYSNTFGHNCYYNTFGDYHLYNTIFGNVLYCNVIGGSSSSSIKNAQILNGTRGTSSSKLTITFTPNVDYTQVAGLNSNGELKIWTPADLV